MTFKAQQRRWRAYGWTTFALGILCDIAGAALVATGGGAVFGLALIATGVGFNSASTATFLHLNYIQYKNGKISAEEYQTDKKLAKISYGLNVGAGFISGAAPAVKLANPKFYAKCTGYLASKFGTAANAATKGGEAATDPLTASLRNSVSQTSRRSSTAATGAGKVSVAATDTASAASRLSDEGIEIEENALRKGFSSTDRPVIRQNKGLRFAEDESLHSTKPKRKFAVEKKSGSKSGLKKELTTEEINNISKVREEEESLIASLTDDKDILAMKNSEINSRLDTSIYPKGSVTAADFRSTEFKLHKSILETVSREKPWNFFGTKQQYINKQYNKLISTVMNNLNYDDSLESVRNAKLLELQARKRVIYSAILFSNSSNFVKLGFYAKKKIEEESSQIYGEQ